MEQNTTKPAADATAGALFDKWFDPIEREVGTKARGFIETMIEPRWRSRQKPFQPTSRQHRRGCCWESGADWRTTHGFGDNAIGTLSFASRSDDIDPKAPRDALGCASALVAHGVPPQELRRGTYSVEVEAYVESLAPAT